MFTKRNAIRSSSLGRMLVILMSVGLLVAGCTATDTATSVRLVSAEEAAAVISDAPPGQIVLDVRTPEEFREAHIADATLVDFYDSDFRDQIAALDRDVSYVLYCRSGNRSAEAARLMDDLGFRSVDEIDGGILSWMEAGLPVVSP